MQKASKKSRQIWEFGDFQTPVELAKLAISVIKRLGFKPRSILEPTCGQGAFLFSSADAFLDANSIIGLDINKNYIDLVDSKINKQNIPIKTIHADFFTFDWSAILAKLNEPILIIGNPPWVTSTELGILRSANLPEKSNFQGYSGIEAITGKSNFDISEWMILRHLEWLQTRSGLLAMLCKTSVARKILTHAWKHNRKLNSARIYKIDALEHFRAAVDACFFIIDCTESSKSKICEVYNTLSDDKPCQTISYHDGQLISDISLYEKWRFLSGTDYNYKWRSGLKHDCTEVMELEQVGDELLNNAGEPVAIEETYLFPLFKSSDISNGHVHECRKYVIVTQQSIGEDTTHIEKDAPQTWNYLKKHSYLLEKRASSIYKNKPPFSMFGVGEYTFSPWKVVISGFYKKLNFQVVGRIAGLPAMFDDTIYFLPCSCEEEARFIQEILNSKPACEFFNSIIFWNDKRPVTASLLKQIDIKALAYYLGRGFEYEKYVKIKLETHRKKNEQQLFLEI